MVPFLLKCFHKCLDRNKSRDLICISCVGQYVEICKHIMLPKSYDVTAK